MGGKMRRIEMPRRYRLAFFSFADFLSGLSAGPTATSVTPAPQMTVVFNGCGVAFLTLKN
jgi:hypothetical protein